MANIPQPDDKDSSIFSTDLPSLPLFQQMSPKQQILIENMMGSYRQKGMTIQATKLIKHALKYVQEGRAKLISENDEEQKFIVTGDDDTYETIYKSYNNSYSCTCKLFQGKGEYKGIAGECSHIQTIRIINIEKQT